MPGGGRGLQNRCGAVTVPGWFNSFPLRHVVVKSFLLSVLCVAFDRLEVFFCGCMVFFLLKL
jgi:hypothetical protein